MKTGFICASGFNLVATATRDDKRLIAVVLGAPSSAARAMKAAQLLERGFNSNTGLSWLMPSLGTVETVQPVDAAPPNLRDEMCGPHRKRPATEDEDEVIGTNNNPDSPYGVFLSSLRPPKAKGAAAPMPDVKLGEPVLVYTGTKPPAPGSFAAGDVKKKTVAAKPPAGKDAAKDKDKDTATAAVPSGDASAPKPKPKPKPKAPAVTDASKDGASTAAGDGTKPKPKPPAPKDATKDGASPTAAGGTAGDGAAPKPKPKKPAPKPAATDLSPPAQQTSLPAR
jgi:D-alanyl-D-alanine carboxypeptidase